MSLEKLIARAFKQGPAYQANQLIDEVRRATRREKGDAINYEVMMMGRTFDHLQREVAPLMALYLRSKRRGLEIAFVSLFVNTDTLVFIRAADFFDVIRESLGLDEEAFREVMDRWARTGRSSAGGLPGGPGEGGG
jgi:hypothetical protein